MEYETRYDIYVTDHGDDTYDVLVRDNELLARYLMSGDEIYTKSYYDIDDHSLKLLKDKYKNNATFFNN